MLGSHPGNGLLKSQALGSGQITCQSGQLPVIHSLRIIAPGLQGGGTSHDQDHLSPGGIFPQGTHDVADGAPPDLLMLLGQFPAESHEPTGAEDLLKILHSLINAVGGLVEDHGPLLAAQGAQMPQPFLMSAGKKSLIAEAVGRQAGEGQGIQHRAGAGRTGDRYASFDGPPDDGHTRIIDGRHARIRDHQRTGPFTNLIQNGIGHPPLVVIVIGHNPAAYTHP